MITIKNKIVSELPLLELVESKQDVKKLPVVFFYHGWESYKERVLEYGYSLAKEGYRVILPEAYNHGVRQENDVEKQDPMNFWEVVYRNVDEFYVLIESYIKKEKILPERIGVAGVSMGGITTSAILTQYDWVKSATVLMGSPSPIEFTKWLLKNYRIDGEAVYDLIDSELIKSRLNELTPVSLNLQPEKIAGRPLYFWHGTQDSIVPIELTKQFIERNENKIYGKNIRFDYTEGAGHMVPKEMVEKTTRFFQETL